MRVRQRRPVPLRSAGHLPPKAVKGEGVSRLRFTGPQAVRVAPLHHLDAPLAALPYRRAGSLGRRRPPV